MLKKVKSPSLVENVVNQVEGAVLAGGLKPGDKLPPTREMQTLLGASLGTIREAMAILEQKGLIEVKKGAKGGYFIRRVSAGSVSESLDAMMLHLRIKPRELAEFRQSAEADLVRLVALRASDEDLIRLNAFVDEFNDCLGQGAIGWRRLLGVERRLREKMMILADNRIHQAVLGSIHSNIMDFSARFLPDDDHLTQTAHDYWVRILEALQKRDGQGAANLTGEMIQQFLDFIADPDKESEGGRMAPRAGWEWNRLREE